MRDAMSVLIRPVVSEKSYASMEKSVYVFIVDRHATKVDRPPRRRASVQRACDQGEHAQPKGEGDAQPVHQREGESPRHQPRHRDAAPDDPSTCSSSDQGNVMPLRSRKPTSPGRRFPDRLGLLRDHAAQAREVAARPSPRPVAATHTAARRLATTTAAVTSSSTGSSTSGATRTASRPGSPPLSTTRTATLTAIALLHYADGEKRYILAPAGVKVDDRLQSGRGADIRPGDTLPLRYIPVGSTVHNVEMRPGGGGKMARGRGMSVQVVAKEGAFATLRLPSTEMRHASAIDCRATLGVVGNSEAELVKAGKAGRNRWKGKRPQTRGVAMNPVDHPLGGGEGKSSVAATRCRRRASPRAAPRSQQEVERHDRSPAPHPRGTALGEG